MQNLRDKRPNLTSLSLLLKGLDVPTEVGLTLMHGNCFGQMPFMQLPVRVEPRLAGHESVALTTEPWLLLLKE